MPRHPACCPASAITSASGAASSPIFASCLPKSGGLRTIRAFFNSPSPHCRAVGESSHRMPGHSRPTGQVQSTHHKTTRFTITKRPGHAHTQRVQAKANTHTTRGLTNLQRLHGRRQRPTGRGPAATVAPQQRPHKRTHTRSRRGNTLGTSAGHTLMGRQDKQIGAQVQATKGQTQLQSRVQRTGHATQEGRCMHPRGGTKSDGQALQHKDHGSGPIPRVPGDAAARARAADPQAPSQ